MNSEQINKIYKQYKKNLKLDFLSINKIIIQETNSEGIAAELKDINYQEGFAILSINAELFSQSSILHNSAILYHEFTHIWDSVKYLRTFQNKELKKKLLFPYTEYHASRIELLKRLDHFIFSKQITLNSSVYDKNRIVSLRDFLKSENEEINWRYEKLSSCPNLNNILALFYRLIYNMGYFSILQENHVEKNFHIDIKPMNYAKRKMHKLYKILHNPDITDQSILDANDLCQKIIDLTSKYYLM